MHRNRFHQSSDLAHRQHGVVEITSSNVTAFRTLSRVEFRKAIYMLGAATSKVAAKTMTKTAFNELEMMTGFRWNPCGVLACRTLHDHVAPLEVVRYDWVHSALQGGIINAEVEAMLAATGIPRQELQSMLADTAWRFPQATATKSKGLHRVFDERRLAADDAEKIKATCSELLGLYGLLRLFFHLKLEHDPGMAANLESFDLACEGIDLLLHCKRGLADANQTADQLESVLQRHLARHIAVYGEGHVRPKHHWMLDVPAQLRRDGLVLDAFVIERTHLQVKAIAQHVKNTTSYERSVLAGLLTVAFRQDAEPLATARLVGRTATLPGFFPRVLVADRLEVFGFGVAVDDVVLRGHAAALVTACAEQDGEHFLVVAPLELAETITRSASMFRQTAAQTVWPATEVVQALAWRVRPDGSILVVRR